jgi:hypothetical protein
MAIFALNQPKDMHFLQIMQPPHPEMPPRAFLSRQIACHFAVLAGFQKPGRAAPFHIPFVAG